MDILLVDDEARVRSALWLLLRQKPGFNVVGEAAEISQALALVAMRRPDVLILDWDLLAKNGKQGSVLEQLRRICPDLYVIALSLRTDLRAPALESGVDAFVYKGDTPDRLMDVLEAVRQRVVLS
ncbi:MAG: response regulator [Anaerolineae bacterium]